MTRMSQLQAQISALQAEVDRGQASIRSMLSDELGIAGDSLFVTLCERYKVSSKETETTRLDITTPPVPAAVSLPSPERKAVVSIDLPEKSEGTAGPAPARRPVPVPVPVEVASEPEVKEPAKSAEPPRFSGASKIDVEGVLVPAAHQELADEIVALAREHAAKGDPNGKYSNDRGKNAWRAKLFKKAYDDASAASESQKLIEVSAEAPETAPEAVMTSKDSRSLLGSSEVEEFDDTPSEELDGSSYSPPSQQVTDRAEDIHDPRRYPAIKPNTPRPMPDDLPDNVHKASRPRPVRPGFLK